MGLKESTGIWGKTPLKWPLAVAGLSFFVVAGGFAVADEDIRVMLYTCVVMGATLIGAWVYALGSHRYSGESEGVDVSDIRRPADRIPDTRDKVSRDTPAEIDTPPE